MVKVKRANTAIISALLALPAKLTDKGRAEFSIHDMNCLSFNGLVVSRCQSDKAITFSRGVITPSLGNIVYSIILSHFMKSGKDEHITDPTIT